MNYLTTNWSGISSVSPGVGHLLLFARYFIPHLYIPGLGWGGWGGWVYFDWCIICRLSVFFLAFLWGFIFWVHWFVFQFSSLLKNQHFSCGASQLNIANWYFLKFVYMCWFLLLAKCYWSNFGWISWLQDWTKSIRYVWSGKFGFWSPDSFCRLKRKSVFGHVRNLKWKVQYHNNILLEVYLMWI